MQILSKTILNAGMVPLARAAWILVIALCAFGCSEADTTTRPTGESSTEGRGGVTTSPSFGNATPETDSTPSPGDGSGGGTTDWDDNGNTDVAPEDLTCETNADCPAATPYCGVSGMCFECTTDNECATDELCSNGLCLPQTCTPGATVCNTNKLLTCNAAGTAWDVYECPGAMGWCENNPTPACVGCEPGYTACSGKSERVVCPADGSQLLTELCPGETFCVEGQCLACYPGTKQCLGDVVQVCTTEGLWADDEDCALNGAGCSGGICQSPCGGVGKLSNEGCDYWAVDMDNIGSAADSPYAVIVSNLNDFPVTVDISAQASESAQPSVVAQGSVAPNDLEIFELPQQNMGATGVFWKALRVQSSGPIVAYQFNPLENVGVYSNDASLLLPSNTYGNEYVVVSREQVDNPEFNGFRGSISVVATSPDTQVTITPSAPCDGGAGILALNAGQPATITLQPYQVFNIRSNKAPQYDSFSGTKLSAGADLTGTIITSDKPIGVFAGHDAAVGGEQCCADHLEQQLFPVNTWGKTYVASKSFARGVEQDYWRLVAATNGTQITVSPSQPGVPGVISLNRGQYYEFKTSQDVIIEANNPIMVAQTLPSSFEVAGPLGCTSSSQCAPGHSCTADPLDFFGTGPMQCTLNNSLCGTASDCPQGYTCASGGFGGSCEPIGDPALILAVPVEQYRDAYVFLTPTNYLFDYVNVVASAGTQVTLDGVLLGPGYFTSIGDGTYVVARMEVSDGVHTLEASAPVGVIAYGYDDDVSYGYPAGLSLSDL